MPMKSPPHPGLHLRSDYLEPLGLTVAEAARHLGVTRQALHNVTSGRSAISPDMALRLSKAFGGRPEVWLAMQMHFDLSQVLKGQDRIKVTRFSPAA